MKNVKRLVSFVVVFMVVMVALCSVSFAEDIQYSENLIPIMTSDTVPSGIVSASSTYEVVPYPSWSAFDDNSASAWCNSSKEGVRGWLAYEFPKQEIIAKYTVTAATSGGNRIHTPNDWTFEALDTSNQWVILDTRKNQINWSSGEKREFVFNNKIPYKKYRINATSGSSYLILIGELEMMKEITLTPTMTLTVESVDKAKVGDEITANMVIHNSTNICAEDIKIAFDSDRLEFVSAEAADGIKIYKEDDLANGIRRYITASLGKANAANGDKILLKLKFKAKAIGGAKIDIVNGRIVDNATLEVDVDQANCGEKIILIESINDVNRSGEFTLLDLGIDAWYYGDAVADTDTTKYDPDQIANGTIDDGDLTEIVNQMLNNKNYPAPTNGQF